MPWTRRGDGTIARRSSLRGAIVPIWLACAVGVTSAQNGTRDVGSWMIRGTPLEARWIEFIKWNDGMGRSYIT
jgi:hypothetical protein